MPRLAALRLRAQAHATAQRVTLFYAARDASCAAYIKDWDAWRGAGVRVEPCYLSGDAAAAGMGAAGGGGNGATAGPQPQAVLVRACGCAPGCALGHSCSWVTGASAYQAMICS